MPRIDKSIIIGYSNFAILFSLIKISDEYKTKTLADKINILAKFAKRSLIKLSENILTDTLSLLKIININVEEELLYSYDWPGNVRELGNLVERISILSQNENKSNITRLLHEILNKNSSQNLSDPTISMSYPLKQARENFEKNYLLNQLRKNKGNISKTAEFIGMERSALHRKLKSLGIKGIN